MVRARTKFIIGGVLVLGTAGYLMATAIGETGMYYLTPGELTAKVKGDSTFYDTNAALLSSTGSCVARRLPQFCGWCATNCKQKQQCNELMISATPSNPINSISRRMRGRNRRPSALAVLD